MADDPILERLIAERLEAAANPADTASCLMGFLAARISVMAGSRACAALLYALADHAAVTGPRVLP